MDKDKKIQQLTEEERYITQEKGTEAPFQNAYWDNHQKGMYRCKVCGEPLFDSMHKFDSRSGWPAYDQPVSDAAIALHEDNGYGMNRIEAVCKKCGAHLGHVFEDGPKETTGVRYCINSASLDFEEEK